MHELIEWSKDHKGLAAALVAALIALVLVFRSSGGSSGGGSVQTVQTGPSDAVVQAELQAGVASQAAQTQATLQGQSLQAQYNLGIAQIAGQTTQDQLAAQLGLAQAQLGAGVANNQTAAQLSEAGIAGTVAQTQLADQLAAAQATDKQATDIATIQAGTTQTVNAQNDAVVTEQLQSNQNEFLGQLASENQLNQQNNAAQEALAATNAGLQLGIVQANAATAINAANDTLQLGTVQSNNATDVAKTNLADATTVALAQTSGAVSVANTATQAAVTNEQTLTAAQLASEQYTYGFDQNYINLVSSGKISGSNAVSVLAAINNQPAIGVSAQGTASASVSGGNSTASIINSAGGLISTIGSALLGA